MEKSCFDWKRFELKAFKQGYTRRTYHCILICNSLGFIFTAYALFNVILTTIHFEIIKQQHGKLSVLLEKIYFEEIGFNMQLQLLSTSDHR